MTTPGNDVFREADLAADSYRIGFIQGRARTDSALAARVADVESRLMKIADTGMAPAEDFGKDGCSCLAMTLDGPCEVSGCPCFHHKDDETTVVVDSAEVAEKEPNPIHGPYCLGCEDDGHVFSPHGGSTDSVCNVCLLPHMLVHGATSGSEALKKNFSKMSGPCIHAEHGHCSLVTCSCGCHLPAYLAGEPADEVVEELDPGSLACPHCKGEACPTWDGPHCYSHVHLAECDTCGREVKDHTEMQNLECFVPREPKAPDPEYICYHCGTHSDKHVGLSNMECPTDETTVVEEEPVEEEVPAESLEACTDYCPACNKNYRILEKDCRDYNYCLKCSTGTKMVAMKPVFHLERDGKGRPCLLVET